MTFAIGFVCGVVAIFAIAVLVITWVVMYAVDELER